jgi:5-methylcytosine-specific restriction endonuclease McrA
MADKDVGRGQQMKRTKGHHIRGTYPSEWPEIAEAAKQRAGYRCERCGHPAEGAWKSNGGQGQKPCDDLCRHPQDGKQRILTVDHLDGDKSNCAEWNLAALCQVCHLTVQGRMRLEQAWAWEHSPWMLPHVLGMRQAYEQGEWPRKE